MRSFALISVIVLVLASGPGVASAAGPTTEVGRIGDANFVIDMPSSWNGTLLVYSHGYREPSSDPSCTPSNPALWAQCNPGQDAGDELTRQSLLSQGFALAGSGYSTMGWAVASALGDQSSPGDQIALMDHFAAEHGHPSRSIAWGHSLGGMVTAGLVQRHPDRFAGALPMCGVLAGGIATWNIGLDGEFIFKTLLAPSSNLQLVHIADPSANLTTAESILAQAQATPSGRARIALIAAMADTPGWFAPLSPEPASTDYNAREQNQFEWDSQVDFPFLFALRADLEAKASGNPSWNTRVNYRQLLERSINRDEVLALYSTAGLSLEDDLATLQKSDRIAADPAAVDYLTRFISYNGDIDIPLLSMHTIGDGLVIPQDEEAYADVVRPHADTTRLRQVFVHRAGHCAFTPAETIAALQALIARVNTGAWDAITSPGTLNARALGLGPMLNVFGSGQTLIPTAPAFVPFSPSEFPRPFDVRNDQDHDAR